MQKSKILILSFVIAILVIFFILYQSTSSIFTNAYVIENFIEKPGNAKKTFLLKNNPSLPLSLNTIFVTKNVKNKILPVFFSNLPKPDAQISNKAVERSNFIYIILPIVVELEQEILADRKVLLEITSKLIYLPLTENDLYSIKTLATKYNVYTPNLDLWDYSIVLESLLKKIDIVPKSLLLANAIIDSNWGTTSDALNNNILFSKVFVSFNCNQSQCTDASSKQKTFKTIMHSVKKYYFAINLLPQYENFRKARVKNRLKSYYLDSVLDAYTYIILNSQNGTYKEQPHSLKSLNLLSTLGNDFNNSIEGQNLQAIIINNNLSIYDNEIKFNDAYHRVNIKIK